MEKLNGSANWNQQQNPPAEQTAYPKQKTGSPPAMAIQHGRIMTRVWANRSSWGEVCWKIDQTRNTVPGTGNFSRSFFLEDLQDAMRGLYAAKRWIKKAERRSRRRWFW